MRIEGEASHGLLAGCAERYVHATVIGQANGHQIFQETLLFRGRPLGIFLKLFTIVGHV
jgi:hypothetical protein